MAERDNPLCPECGAAQSDRDSCQTYLGELLALESLVPGGPTQMAHFFAIASFNLQHPSSFTTEVLESLRRSLDNAVAGRVDIPTLRRRARYVAEGPKRVLRRDAAADDKRPSGWPSVWPMTVLDVCRAAPDTYNAKAEEWARSVAVTLARARPVDSPPDRGPVRRHGSNRR
jgi:hypothetical protein